MANSAVVEHALAELSAFGDDAALAIRRRKAERHRACFVWYAPALLTAAACAVFVLAYANTSIQAGLVWSLTWSGLLSLAVLLFAYGISLEDGWLYQPLADNYRADLSWKLLMQSEDVKSVLAVIDASGTKVHVIHMLLLEQVFRDEFQQR